jgi:hypothetical protein
MCQYVAKDVFFKMFVMLLENGAPVALLKLKSIYANAFRTLNSVH